MKQRNNILLLKRHFDGHKPSVVLFCILLLVYLPKPQTLSGGRDIKDEKCKKHWASSKSTQLTAAISRVNSHWFISRCKLVGLDIFSVVKEACSLSGTSVWNEEGCFYLLFNMNSQRWLESVPGNQSSFMHLSTRYLLTKQYHLQVHLLADLEVLIVSHILHQQMESSCHMAQCPSSLDNFT